MPCILITNVYCTWCHFRRTFVLRIEICVWYFWAVFVRAPGTNYLNMVMGEHIIVHIATHVTPSFVLITTHIVTCSTFMLSQFTYFVETLPLFCLHVIHYCCQSLQIQATSCCLSPMLLPLSRAHCYHLSCPLAVHHVAHRSFSPEPCRKPATHVPFVLTAHLPCRCLQDCTSDWTFPFQHGSTSHTYSVRFSFQPVYLPGSFVVVFFPCLPLSSASPVMLLLTVSASALHSSPPSIILHFSK